MIYSLYNVVWNKFLIVISNLNIADNVFFPPGKELTVEKGNKGGVDFNIDYYVRTLLHFSIQKQM